MATPGQVTNVVVTASSYSLQVRWDKITASPTVTAYYIYRFTSNAKPGTTYTKVNATGTENGSYGYFYDFGAVSGTTYYYWVSAYNGTEGTASVTDTTGPDVSYGSVTYTAPYYQLRSFSDIGDGTSDPGITFMFPLDVLSDITEADSSNLASTPIPAATAENAIVIDMNGPSREILLSGELVDGKSTWIDGGYSGTDNASWVKRLRLKMGQAQCIYGPYRLVMVASTTTYSPNYTPADNYYVYISSFSYGYNLDFVGKLSWQLKLTVGASL